MGRAGDLWGVWSDDVLEVFFGGRGSWVSACGGPWGEVLFRAPVPRCGSWGGPVGSGVLRALGRVPECPWGGGGL